MPSSPETERGADPAGRRSAGPPVGSEMPDGVPPQVLRQKVDEVRQELARMDERHKRALADLDNYRKRSAREIERRVSEQREQLLRDWLEVVDSVDRAVAIERDDTVAQGLKAVMGQMQSVLARHGVERVQPKGESFDPVEHEAVASQPSAEVPANTVLEVVRPGYRLGDRVLRPAQVVVSSGRQGGER